MNLLSKNQYFLRFFWHDFTVYYNQNIDGTVTFRNWYRNFREILVFWLLINYFWEYVKLNREHALLCNFLNYPHIFEVAT